MVNTKKINFNNLFLFLFLVLFPFGQIIRFGIIQPLDVVVGMAAIYSIYKKLPLPPKFSYLLSFLGIAGISWLFSLTIFPVNFVWYGLLYLIRLSAYIYFLVYVWNFAKQKDAKFLLVDSLLAVSVISAVFGWIQVAVFPDLKPLFIWGWDMHLYRLAGTFFDPAFLGLIIVFGLLICVAKLLGNWNKKYIVISIFLLLSLAFTYSRASYLAFIAGMAVIAIYKREWKKAGFVTFALIIIAILLPTAKNHSIELLRGFSVLARIQNYATTIDIFKHSPVIGVGYDNMCIAYREYIGFQKFTSHACSGSDSSLLFILATTGITGFFVFVYSIRQFYKGLTLSKFALIAAPILVALLVHSQFSNSMFYSWIMGYLVIISVLIL